MAHEGLELEATSGEFKPRVDTRRHMPEPPPVRLVAVEDVHLPAVTGLAPQLDAFYAGLLKFEREQAEAALVYKAENFRLRFDVQSRPLHREDFRALRIEVPVLADLERALIEMELEYERQRGLSAAQDHLVLRDPAGNWVSIVEMRELR